MLSVALWKNESNETQTVKHCVTQFGAQGTVCSYWNVASVKRIKHNVYVYYWIWACVLVFWIAAQRWNQLITPSSSNCITANTVHSYRSVQSNKGQFIQTIFYYKHKNWKYLFRISLYFNLSNILHNIFQNKILLF